MTARSSPDIRCLQQAVLAAAAAGRGPGRRRGAGRLGGGPRVRRDRPTGHDSGLGSHGDAPLVVRLDREDCGGGRLAP